MSNNQNTHDTNAKLVQPYFIKNVLMDRNNDLISRQVTNIVVKNWSPLVGHLPLEFTTAKRHQYGIPIIKQCEQYLKSFEIAIPSNKLQTYRDISNELLLNFQEHLDNWYWEINVKNNINDWRRYANGEDIKLQIAPVDEMVQSFLAGWQLQVLNLYYVKNFKVRPFHGAIRWNQFFHVNLYEMGLTNLPNRIWMQWLLKYDKQWIIDGMNEYHQGYDRLQKAYRTNRLPRTERAVIQHAFIGAISGTNPTELTRQDRAKMYYKQLV